MHDADGVHRHHHRGEAAPRGNLFGLGEARRGTMVDHPQPRAPYFHTRYASVAEQDFLVTLEVAPRTGSAMETLGVLFSGRRR